MVSSALSSFSTGMLVHVRCIEVSTQTCKQAEGGNKSLLAAQVFNDYLCHDQARPCSLLILLLKIRAVRDAKSCAFMLGLTE